MLLHDFSARAEEFIRLAQRTHSSHDRELFTNLARACFGLKEEEDEFQPANPPPQKH